MKNIRIILARLKSAERLPEQKEARPNAANDDSEKTSRLTWSSVFGNISFEEEH